MIIPNFKIHFNQPNNPKLIYKTKLINNKIKCKYGKVKYKDNIKLLHNWKRGW